MGKSRKSKKKAEEVFHVEVITKARVALASPDEEDTVPDSCWEYYVKWAGYASDANSWEPTKNVESCERLLESFWSHIGTDNQDYYPGHVVSASDEWIEKEKKFFAKEYQTALAEKKRTRDEARKNKSSREPPSAPVASTSKVQKFAMSEDESSESSAEEEPLKQARTKKPSPENKQPLKIKLPPITTLKKRNAIISSSDDEPLSKVSRPQKIAKTSTGDVTNSEVIEIPSSPAQAESPNSLFSDTPASETIPAKNLKVTVTSKASRAPNKPGRRSINPQGSIASMAPSEIPAVSGISTKQRIAQGALSPTLPKEMIPPKPIAKPQPKPLDRTTLSSLKIKKLSFTQETSFPESTQNPSASRNVPNEPTLSSLNSPGAHPPTPTTFFTPNASFSTPAPTFLQWTSPPEPTVSPAMIFQPPPIMDQATEFLQDIMPDGLAAPMNMDATEQPVEVPPPKAVNPRIPLPGRIKKGWKWTGPLCLNSDIPLCNIMIHNVTTEISLRFSIVFQDKEKVNVSTLYDMADIRCILSAFRKPSQMGQLSPSKEMDTQPLGVLAAYMHKMWKAFLIPIILDDNVIGQVLCIPYGFYRSLFLEVPSDAYQSYLPTQLVAIILPYTLSQSQLQHTSLRSPSALPKMVQYTADNEQWKRSMRTNPQYHHALSMLNFPPTLLKFVGEPEYPRPYAIWSGKESGNSLQKFREGLETRLLEGILNQAKAKKANSVRSEVRIIFVHVGALKTIHQLPEFVERRATFQHIHFYLYGSDPDIPPSLWSVREIWPCGGIVTFTPSAMRNNPAEAYNLISQISRHPMWACYILPSVLGMVATMECGAEEPLKVFDEHKLVADMILQAIEDGDIAFIEAPPEMPTVNANLDIHAQWFSKNIAFMPPTKREALEIGVKAFQALQDLPKSMEAEITANMSRMHRHPAFISEYRRYVVVCSAKDDAKVNTHSDGFEWTTMSAFDFKDKFYPKQTVGSK